jgi:N-acetylglutamate synthase-like GNAT family acetyltransferase
MQSALQIKSDIAIIPYDDRFKRDVGELIVGIQQNEFNVPITYDDQPDLQDIPTFYQKNGGNFWLALDGSHVVGTIALIDAGHGIGVLRKMFVDKNYRGKASIGKYLLDTLLSWAQMHQIQEIYLGTLEQMHDAHRFYERNGFKRISNDALPECVARIRMKVDTRYYYRSNL